MSDWNAAALEGLCASFLVLSVGSGILRFYSRHKHHVPFLTDDWLSLAAVVSFIGLCVCMFIGIHNQVFGYSDKEIGLPFVMGDTFKLGEQLIVSITIISIANLSFSKLSALFFYRRLFVVPGSRLSPFSIITWTSIALVVLWSITFIIFTGFQCGTDISALWNFERHAKECIYTYPSTMGLAISDVIIDVGVLFMPIPLILKLQMNVWKKLAVVAVLLFGAVGLGASIGRLVVWVQLYNLGPEKAQYADTRIIQSRVYFYFLLEAGMSIVAINSPVIYFIFFGILPRAMTNAARRFSRSITSLLGSSNRSSNKSLGSDSDLEKTHTTYHSDRSTRARNENDSVDEMLAEEGLRGV